MRRTLVVDIDYSRKDCVHIGPMKNFNNETIKPDPILDMACLCEAVCTMIHLCHNEGIKDESLSLRDCINHLKKGFVDETFRTQFNPPKPKL